MSVSVSCKGPSVTIHNSMCCPWHHSEHHGEHHGGGTAGMEYPHRAVSQKADQQFTPKVTA